MDAKGTHKLRTKKELLEILENELTEGSYEIHNAMKYRDTVHIKRKYKGT